MRTGYKFFAAVVAAGAMTVATIAPAAAKCQRLAFSVNDYGIEGPKRDAKRLLDKYIAEWTAERGIANYKTGAKSVSCELFIDVLLFDEHTCRAEATFCWSGNASNDTPAKRKTADSSEADAEPEVQDAVAEVAPTPEPAAETEAVAETVAEPEAASEPKAIAETATEAPATPKKAAAEIDGDTSEPEVAAKKEPAAELAKEPVAEARAEPPAAPKTSVPKKEIVEIDGDISDPSTDVAKAQKPKLKPSSTASDTTDVKRKSVVSGYE